MANVDPFVVQWPAKWVGDPDIGPVVHYLNRFLHDLWIRTGGGSDAIEAQDVAEVYPWPTNELLEETIGFSYPPIEQAANEVRTVTTSVNYTALDGDFINAKANAQITFPEYPNENAVIIVRNGDGSNIKLVGNGKNMNGESTGLITRLGTSIEFHYFIDSDEWFAR